MQRQSTRSRILRVTGLPIHSSAPWLEYELLKLINSEISIEERISLHIKVDCIPSCDTQTLSALVEIAGGFPAFLADLEHDPLTSWQTVMNGHDITFDSHFFGFTQLYFPSLLRPVTTDIIAITGLDGHAYGSWRGKGNLGRMWLRHFLQKDFPDCRTMIYGYNSKLSSPGIGGLSDFVRNLSEGVKRIRNKKELWERPLIFIAHSFGGLLVAQLLVTASQAQAQRHPAIAALPKATYAILFFGTPHNGLPTSDLAQMVGKGHPRLHVIHQLQTSSASLQKLRRDFKEHCQDYQIVSFYETHQTRQLELDPSTQTWRRTGPFATAVDPESALLDLPDHREIKIPVDKDHSHIVKFDSQSDEGYKSAVYYLQEFQRGGEKVAQRFAQPPSEHAVSLPFSRNQKFVGRHKELETLERLTASRGISVLYGLGGVGKTATALELAYRVREKHPSWSILWISCASLEAVASSYRDIRRKFELADGDVKRLFNNHLNAGKWFAVLDGLDDGSLWFKADLQGIPVSKGSVLLTTRSRQVSSLFKPLAETVLGELTMTTSIAMLNSHLISDFANPEKLLKLLAFHPLAIVQAAAYISVNGIESSQAFSESAAWLSHDFKDATRYPGKNDIHSNLVRTFNQVKASNQRAFESLSRMAFIDSTAIPATLFKDRAALNHLEDYSFIHNRKTGHFDMNDLVHLVARHWFGQGAAAETVSWLHNAFPSLTSGNIEVWRSYLPHARVALRSCSDNQHPLWETVGRCFFLLGRYGDAKSFFWRRASTQAKVDSEHPDVLTNMAAEQDHRARIEAWEMRKKLLGQDHPDTVSSAADVAKTSKKIQLDEAEKLWREVVEIRTAAFGAEALQSLNSQVTLAVILWKQRRFSEAEKLETYVVEMRTKILGLEHPDTLTSMLNLAMTLSTLKRGAEAEQLERSVLEVRKRKLGDEHPDTLKSKKNLVRVLSDQKRWADAEKLEAEVLEVRKRDPKHPDTIASMASLLVILREQSRWADAEKLAAEVLELRKEVSGPEHPKTLASMVILALILWKQKRWAEAEKLEVTVVEVRERVLGALHRNTIASMRSLGKTLSKQNRWAEVETLRREALKRATEAHGADDADTIAAMDELASALSKLEQLDEAEELFRKVVQWRTRVHGAEHSSTLAVMSDQAWMLSKLKRFAEAEPLRRQILDTTTKLHGAEHPQTLAAMRRLARALRQLDRTAEAEALWRDVLEVEAKVLGAEHANALESMEGLAAMLKTYNVPEAEKLWRGVMDVRLKALGAENLKTLKSMGDVASALSTLRRFADAEQLQREILETRKRIQGVEHTDTLTAMIALARTLKQHRTPEGVALLAACVAAREQTGSDTKSSRILEEALTNAGEVVATNSAA